MNMKVFEIKAHAANGNDRTIHSVVSLNVTLADVCKENIIGNFHHMIMFSKQKICRKRLLLLRQMLFKIVFHI